MASRQARCVNCGTPLEPGMAQCPTCGVPVGEGPMTAEIVEEPTAPGQADADAAPTEAVAANRIAPAPAAEVTRRVKDAIRRRSSGR